MNNLLVDALMQYNILGNGKSIKFVTEKLPTCSFSEELDIGDKIDIDICANIIETYGQIINKDEYMLYAIVGSGFSNMNPTILIIKIENGNMYLKAAAKEGLIKQKSSEKAIKNFIKIIRESF